MPDYNPSGRRRFKQLRDKADTTPRVGQIVGIPADQIALAVGRIVCSGCAVLFSPTSDGGAISITVYYGEERSRDYSTTAAEFAEALVLAGDLAESHAYSGPINGVKPAVRPSENART
jgi:hypothetical protein